MAAESNDRRHERAAGFRFSLRSIFVVMTTVCIGLGVPWLRGVTFVAAGMLVLIVVIIILQTPIFLAFRWFGWLPQSEESEDEIAQTGSSEGPDV